MRTINVIQLVKTGISHIEDVRVRYFIFSCLRKVRYKNYNQAAAAAGAIYNSRGVVLQTYHCTNCDGWHLTRRK